MLKVYIKIFLFTIFCLVGMFLYSPPAIAVAVSSGITVNPSVKEVVISPNQHTETFPVHVTNNTPSEITLSVSIVDFGALDESGGIAFLGEGSNLERKYGLAGWSTIDKSSLTLKPAQSGEINVTVINRPSLALGGHYGAILFKQAALPGSDPQKVKFNQVFSALILAKKAGGDKYDLSLNKVERKNSLYTLPDTVSLRFYNGGNIHIAPGGTVRLVDPLGREVAKGTINPEVGRVLPEKFRTFTASLERTSPVWVPGRYQLIVRYNFNERNSFVTYKSSFLFINGLGIGLLSVLCLLLIYIIWRRKRIKPYFKKRTQPAKELATAKSQTTKRIKIKFD